MTNILQAENKIRLARQDLRKLLFQVRLFGFGVRGLNHYFGIRRNNRIFFICADPAILLEDSIIRVRT
jgi:hypothetical protein